MSLYVDTHFTEAAAEIEAHLRTWPRSIDAGGTVPVLLYEERAPNIRRSKDPFVVLKFESGNSEQKTLGAPGNNYWESNSVFLVTIFVPNDELLSVRAYPWADEIADMPTLLPPFAGLTKAG